LETELAEMKKFIFLLVVFPGIYNSNAQVPAKDFSKLEWLIGEWNRTNAKEGTSGIEKWIKNSNTELQGWGISLKGSDTSFVEKTKLIIKDNSIYYVADVPENKQLVYFKLIAITNQSFICENLQHDFPKKVIYKREGPVLKATISGNGKSIDYLFERKR
jgi:hypothetical protein